MFFKKKKKHDEPLKFSFRFSRYGEDLKEFIIFAGSADKDVQTKENMWVSWDLVERFLANPILIREFSRELERETENYVESEMDKRFKI